MKIERSLFLSAVMLVLPSVAFAQSYYDDDIYYDASKAKKEKKEVVTKSSSSSSSSAKGNILAKGNDGNIYVVTPEGNAYPTSAVNFQGADSYDVNSGSTRDVDEYNRRYTSDDIVASDSLQRDNFANTRMIEKFYNPDIVVGSGDDDLMQYYQSSDPTEVNIYVSSPWAYGYGYGYPYYSSYYWNRWNWGWGWDPWYTSWYGPGWYGDPYWAWSWGWDPWFTPGWGYTWGHHHHGWDGWGGGFAHHQSSPGAMRPHNQGNIAQGAGGRRGTGFNGARPSSANAGGYRNSGVNPSSMGGSYRGSAGTRPSAGSYGGGGRTSRPNAGTVINNSGSFGSGSSYGGGYRSSGNSYNSSSTRSSGSNYHSSGSSSSGSRGSYSGGSHSSGSHSGGGGRGGRH